MLKNILILVLVMISSISYANKAFLWQKRYVPANTLYLDIRGYTNGLLYPAVSQATTGKTNVMWTNPLGQTTNWYMPDSTFFLSNGIYKVFCTNWADVIWVTVDGSYAPQTHWLYGIRNAKYISKKLTGLTSLNYSFRYQTNYMDGGDWNFSGSTNITGMYNAYIYSGSRTFPDFSTPNKISDLRSAFSYCNNMINGPNLNGCVTVSNYFTSVFYGCYNVTNIPSFTNLVNINSLNNVFGWCTNLLVSPYVNTFTNLLNLQSTWIHCENMKTAPVLSNVTSKLVGLGMRSTFEFCTSMTNAPVFTQTNSCTQMIYMFKDCWSMTDTPNITCSTGMVGFTGAFLNCKKMKIPPSLSGAGPATTTLTQMFQGCDDLQYPVVFPSHLTNITGIVGMYSSCTNLRSAPVLSGLKKLNSITSAFYGCNNITSRMDTIFGDYLCISNLATCSQAFDGCSNLTGVASNFINAPKSSTFLSSINNYTNTFRGCVSLSDYNSIPMAWGGPDGFSANGGVITTNGLYIIHTFESSGTFTVNYGSKSVDMLVIGGGGGGGTWEPNTGFGGGGGAGEVVYTSGVTIASTKTITVADYSPSNLDGYPSFVVGVVTASCGYAGYPGYDYGNSGDGGVSGNGYVGGFGVSAAAGGGAGSYENGGDGNFDLALGGIGGSGTTNSITGTLEVYSAGGPGSGYDGSYGWGYSTKDYGNGGGGAPWGGEQGYLGVVIIRYLK